MKARAWLPSAIFAAVFSRHVLVDFIAAQMERPDYARRALFYAFGGAVSALLYGLIWALVPWRPESVRIATALVCSWGVMEEAQVAGCRIAWGVTRPASAPMWQGLCDQMSGVPLSTMSLVIPVVIAYWLLHRPREGDDAAS